MRLRRGVGLAGLLVLGLAGPAMAQVPAFGNLPTFDNAPAAPPPGAAPAAPMAPPMGAPPGAGGGMMSGPPPGGPPGGDACARDFLPLRQEAERRGSMIKAVMDKAAKTKTPPPRAEACKLFRNMVVAMTKMLNFVTENKAACRIPDEAIQGIKTGTENLAKNRDNACASGPLGAAPGGPPPGPRLSDELGVGIARPDGTPGRGTFDTLTGNALTR
jgi:hypothetical protein